MVADGSRRAGGRGRVFAVAACTLLAAWIATVAAQINARGFEPDAVELDHPAIGYRVAAQTDPIAQLNQRLLAGTARLTFEGPSGYLRSLLNALDIPVESQMAVFSKTSLQGARVNPSNPRTIFFNDNVAVAWMRGGFIEIAAQDPTQGIGFYLLPQESAMGPRLFPMASAWGATTRPPLREFQGSSCAAFQRRRMEHHCHGSGTRRWIIGLHLKNAGAAGTSPGAMVHNRTSAT